ncbi:hypothetical protein JW935_10690 [candidate division KSB1 bacterium]|nr:hypothetical protein [candidate division KSB1 bacterium]
MKTILVIFILLSANLTVYGQELVTVEKLYIDFWLNLYPLAQVDQKVKVAYHVFEKLLRVADKPIGVLPELYILDGLKLGQVLALPDGSIILPSRTIDFCNKAPQKYFETRLAFILGHELKHILKEDYNTFYTLQNFLATGNSPETDFQRYWQKIVYDQYDTSRRFLEKEADEYGILYASLAGFNVEPLLSESGNFIKDYHIAAGISTSIGRSELSPDARRDSLLVVLSDISGSLDLYHFANYLYVIGFYDQAIEAFKKFVQRYPSKNVFNNLGLCYYQKAYHLYNQIFNNERFDLSAFRLSISFDPTSGFAAADNNFRGLSKNQGRQQFNTAIQNALEYFNQALSRDPRYEITLNNIGCAYLLKGELDFAKGYFKKAMDVNPYSLYAYNNLGVALIKEYEETNTNSREILTNFWAALSIRGDYCEALYNLVQFNLLKNQMGEAEKYFQRYLTIDKYSVYSKRLSHLMDSEIGTSVNIKFFEKEILNKIASPIKENSKKKQFKTPRAIFEIAEDTENNYIYYTYRSDASKEQIKITQTGPEFQGSTTQGIRIFDPVALISEKYPIEYATINAGNLEYRIYCDMELIFEISGQKVKSWVLYCIVH